MATAPSRASSASKTAELDPSLHAFGFEIDVVSAGEVTGRLKVTESCCQASGVLHGGMSALVSESLGSMGAHIASGFRRVAGIQMSVTHYTSAAIGDDVFARAVPVHVSKTTQVWEVCLWKMDPSTLEKGDLLASSKVTLLTNLSVPENAKDAEHHLRKYAKL